MDLFGNAVEAGREGEKGGESTNKERVYRSRRSKLG